MPTPFPATPGPRLTRRAALGAVVGGGLVACTPPRRGLERRERRPEPVEPEVDPDVAVATEALAAQTAIIELVRATQERHGSLRRALTPVLAAHEAHAALLSDAVPAEATASASASPSASGSPSPSAPAGRRAAVPKDRTRALKQVVAAEQELTTTTKRHAFKAQSGSFARVLGSMAAAAAQNAVVLASPTGGPA
ncbi:MAG TPA: hypothetical protein VFR87_14010 [Nocardioidaceae bacterium]|nr:hypothetical protein [Nocardioidaceae bacterium]